MHAKRYSLLGTRISFILLSALWAAFAIYSLFRNSGEWILPALMIANAAVLLTVGILIAEETKFAAVAAYSVLAINIILTVTDEFGIFDLVVLVLYLAALILLIISRRSRSADKRSRP